MHRFCDISQAHERMKGAAPASLVLVAQLLLGAPAPASSAAAGGAKLWLDPTQDVETRLAALLPTLSVEQLMTQTQHLWTSVHMDTINQTYGKTGVGAAYSNHPTGDSNCDTDPVCNLAARLALNRALMASLGLYPKSDCHFLFSTALQPLYTSFPIIFSTCFSKVTVGYHPRRAAGSR
jgi:hypothetical protein